MFGGVLGPEQGPRDFRGAEDGAAVETRRDHRGSLHGRAADAPARAARDPPQFVTTRPDPSAARPPDLVRRHFTASRPNELWVVDFTYVPTWSGMGFTAFVTDVFSRRIVGWRTTNRMPTELPLDALEMALWVRARAGEEIAGVVHHSDAGPPGFTARSMCPTLGSARCQYIPIPFRHVEVAHRRSGARRIGRQSGWAQFVLRRA